MKLFGNSYAIPEKCCFEVRFSSRLVYMNCSHHSESDSAAIYFTCII